MTEEVWDQDGNLRSEPTVTTVYAQHSTEVGEHKTELATTDTKIGEVMNLSTTPGTTDVSGGSVASTKSQDLQDEANTKTEDKTTTNSAFTEVSVQHRAEKMLGTATVTLGTTKDNEARQEENNILKTTNEFTHATTDSEAVTTMSMKDATAMQSEQEQPRKQTRGLESSNQRTTVWGLSEATTEASQQAEFQNGTTAKSRVQSEGSFGTTDAAMTSDYAKSRDASTMEDSLQRMSLSSTVENGLQTDGENPMTTARNGGSESWPTVEFQPNSKPMPTRTPTEDKPTESHLDLQQYTAMNKMELSTVESHLDSTSVKDTTKEESETGDSKETTIQDEALATVSKKAEVRTETIVTYTDDEFIQSSTTPEDKKLGFSLVSTVSNDFETESQHHMVTEMDNDGASGTQGWSTREGNHQITRKLDIDVIPGAYSMASKDMQYTLTTEGTIDVVSGDLDANSGEEFMSTRETANPVTAYGNIDVNSGKNHASTIDMQHSATTNRNTDVNSGEEFTSTREIEHQVKTGSNIDTGFKDHPMPTGDLKDSMTTNSNMDATSGQNHMTTRDMLHLMTTNSNIDDTSGEKSMSTRVTGHPLTTNSNIDAGFEDEFTSTRDMGHPETTSSNTGVSAEENLILTRHMDHSMTTNNNVDVVSGNEPLSPRDITHQTTISRNFYVSYGDEFLSTRDMDHSVTTNSNINFSSGEESLPKSTTDIETYVTTVNMPDVASGERSLSSSVPQLPMTTEGNKRATYSEKSTSIGGMQYKTSSNIEVSSRGESTRYVQDDRTTEINAITGKVSSSTTSVLHPMTTDSDIHVGSGEESMSTSETQATSKPRTTVVSSHSERFTSMSKVEKTTVQPSLEYTTVEGPHNGTTLTLEKTNKGISFQSTNAPEIVSTQIVGMFNFLMKLYFIFSCFVKKKQLITHKRSIVCK